MHEPRSIASSIHVTTHDELRRVNDTNMRTFDGAPLGVNDLALELRFILQSNLNSRPILEDSNLFFCDSKSNLVHLDFELTEWCISNTELAPFIRQHWFGVHDWKQAD